MDKPAFVYVTYIKSTPEKVWAALTAKEFTQQYWSNHHNASDWKVGSRWEHQDADDSSIVDVVGTVLESDYPRHLSVSWASPGQFGVEEKTSRVTYDLAQAGGLVRLTVTHDNLEPGSNMLRSISTGWPQVLASLKSLLETGEPLPTISVRGNGKWEAKLEFR